MTGRRREDTVGSAVKHGESVRLTISLTDTKAIGQCSCGNSETHLDRAGLHVLAALVAAWRRHVAVHHPDYE